MGQRRDGEDFSAQDNGRGFAVPAAFHNLTAQGHFGLVGMQERVNLIGGTMAVESAPGQGTTVRVVWQRQEARLITLSQHLDTSEWRS